MAVTRAETLIRQYFDWLNARRLSDVAGLFAPEAVIVQAPYRQMPRGAAGFQELANAWLTAFPDASVTVERVISRDEVTQEAQLASTGTHRGALDLGSLVFQPTGAVVTLHFRTLLQLREGQITYSNVTFDVQEMVEQLVVVDVPKVLSHLERIRKEGDRLTDAKDDPTRSREIVQRLGLEIDAARHAVRPYFRR